MLRNKSACTLRPRMQALAARRLPSAAGIEAALQQLRAEEGGSGSDDEAGGCARRGTALAKEPLEYFGFVG